MGRGLARLGGALIVALAATAQGDDAVKAETSRLAALGLEVLLERQQRLLRVYEQIRVAGAELCPNDRKPVLGLLAVTSRELPIAYREIAKERYGVDDRVRVLFVLPGFPADRAGIRAGDVLRSLGGKKLRNARMMFRIGSGTHAGSIGFALERDGEMRELELLQGCFFAGELLYSDVTNAFAATQASQMVMLTGMTRFTESDDELAVVLGHELAHLVMRWGGTRAGEADADYLGSYFAARAGFDVTAGPGFWRRVSIEYPYSIEREGFYRHPSSPARMLALDAAVREIQTKRERGEPLEPERR